MINLRLSLRFVYCLVACSLVAVPLVSQKLFVKNYTTANGLVSNDVSWISQDKSGRIWIGSALGLEWYDGTSHVQRSMYLEGGDAVHSVWRSAKADTLIFGGDRGFLAVGGEEWRAYSLLEDKLRLRIKGNVNALLYDSDKRLWAGIEGLGLLLIPAEGRPLDLQSRPNSLLDSLLFRAAQVHLKGRTVYSILETSHRSIFIGTDHGAVELPRGDWNLLRNPIPGFKRGGVNAIIETKSGDICFGTDNGLYVLRHGALKHYSRGNGLPENAVTSIAENLDGEIWIGMRYSGLALMNGNTFRKYTADDGLTSNRIHSVFVDSEGNLWVATANGVSKILRQRYESFADVSKLKGLEFHSVAKDHRGRMWFGVTGGVVMYDGAFHVYRGDVRLRNHVVSQIYEDSRHNLWLNAGTALARFSESSFRIFEDANITDQSPIAQIMEDSKGSIWVASPSRLYNVEGDKLSFMIAFPSRCYSFTADAKEGIWMSGNEGTWRYFKGSLKRVSDGGGTIFAGSDKNIWLVHGEGVAVIRRNDNDSIQNFPNPEAPGGSPASYYYNTGYEDRQGQKWFATNFSMQLLTPNGLETVQSTTVLLHSQRMLEDADGYLWLLSSKGLVRFNRVTHSFAMASALTNVTGGNRIWTDYDPNVSRVAMDNDGNLWVATGPSVVKLYRRSRLYAKPYVFISRILLPTSIILPGKSWWYGGRLEIDRKDPWLRYWFDQGGEGLDLSFEPDDTVRVLGNNSLAEFEFKGISYSDEDDVRYQYRLANFDREWSAISKDTKASYPNLKDGLYTFHVRAIDGNGNMSDERRLSLIVTSPFWKAIWFWIYAAITLVYGTGRLYQRRMVRLRLRHREETERAVLTNEMQMARKIQLGMLPMETPKGKGFEIAAKSIPAREVGGDFYDFAEVADEVYSIAVGDVSGHGLTGAMIVGMARTSLRFAMQTMKSPGDILTLANTRLYDDIKRNFFVAVFFAQLEFKSRTFTYTNAGQVMPLLCRKGKAKFLPYSSGDRFPLGIIPQSRYRQGRIHLQKGDVLLLYTDGIVEAMNAQREEFGFDRLLQALEQVARNSTVEIVDGIVSAVGSFTGEVEKQDDLTLVVIKAV